LELHIPSLLSIPSSILFTLSARLYSSLSLDKVALGLEKAAELPQYVSLIKNQQKIDATEVQDLPVLRLVLVFPSLFISLLSLVFLPFYVSSSALGLK
jgi:hypothetical protein